MKNKITKQYALEVLEAVHKINDYLMNSNVLSRRDWKTKVCLVNVLGFIAELEWRIMMQERVTVKDIHYRFTDKNGNLIPYREVKEFIDKVAENWNAKILG